MKIKNLQKKIVIIILILILGIIIIYKIQKNIYKENFSDLEEKNILLPIPNENITSIYIRETFNQNQIPLNLFTCWHTKDLPVKMRQNITKIKEENPEFSIYIFDNNDCRNIIEKYFIKEVLDAYDSLKPDAYKADLWRYCILYLYGGIYQDVKYEPIDGFRYKELTDNEYFVKDRIVGGSGIYNALLVCKKNNNILEKAIKQIIKNCKEKYYGENSLCPTGPMMLKMFFSNYDFNNLELQFDGNIKDSTDNNIFKKNKKILKMYNGYRDEQKNLGTKYYTELWLEKNIYNK
jgi:mannosyltransferase OCH1-like enzyme